MMIHRFWTGSDRPALQPGFQDWDDESIPKEWFELVDRTAPFVRPAERRRHCANVIRLLLLHTYGGMWADYDLTFLGPPEQLPSLATASHGTTCRCNCWMAFPAGHEALEVALDAIAGQYATDELRSSTEVSGEYLLNRLWGDDIGLVPVYIDVDGSTNPNAPKLLAHYGGTTTRRLSEAAQCPPKPLVDFQ